MRSTFLFSRGRAPRRPADEPPSPILRAICAVLAGLALGACVLAPAGLREERDRAAEAGQAFETPPERREIPELPPSPTWRDLLARAFAANGGLEADYFAWKASLERVAAAAGYPNTNLMPSFGFLVSGDHLKAWDRTTVQVGFDPMQDLSLPNKVAKAGEVALAEARAAGGRFRAAKFSLQREVLEGWLDLALLEEQTRIQGERVELLRLAAESAARSGAVGGSSSSVLRSQIGFHDAHIELGRLETESRGRRAQLNGLLGRASDSPLDLPPSLPEPRALEASDADLLSAAAENNPDLAALASAANGAERALELARLQYLPDLNPFASFTGSLERTIGVGVTLPTALPRIRAGIAAAEAELRRSQAELRQARLDRQARFVATLAALRYHADHAGILERELAPAASLLVGAAERAYATGSAGFQDLLEAHRAALDVRAMLAEVRIAREKSLAELEEQAGLDVETLDRGGEIHE